MKKKLLRTTLAAAIAVLVPASGTAQQRSPDADVVSPEVQPDRHITFRIYAPDAKKVTIQGGDIPELARTTKPFKKNEKGIWEVTVGPVDPGAYRYRFAVDGVTTMDSKNPSVSESNTTFWSLVDVPGAEFLDLNQVPHGAVAAVNYYSTSLKRFRRMHVYTPPGYEAGNQRYPVFYLLHGSSDSDASWSTVGRAGFILDNLIAAKKAKPMIIVMPAGHTSRMPQGGSASEEFAADFMTDIMPYVEKNYRSLNDRANRAMAGLSMGGGQTLWIGMAHLDQFAYLGVFSAGVFSNRPRTPASAGTPAPPPVVPEQWVQERQAMLDNPALKKGLNVLWFATGKDDFLLPTTKVTVQMLSDHGFTPVMKESGGGHTWLNWRDYLNEFAPKLFQ